MAMISKPYLCLFGGYKNEKGEIIKEKSALFVIISDTDVSFNFIVSLMYAQLFNVLCDLADGRQRFQWQAACSC